MKIALTADWHVRGKDLDACDRQLAALEGECIQRQVDHVIVAGDVFNSPNIGDQYASTGAQARVALQHVFGLVDAGIEVWLIDGNHDVAGAGSKSALHIFDGHPSIHVYHEPADDIMTSAKTEELVNVIFLPWQYNADDPDACISFFDTWDIDLLVAHVRVPGARMSGAFTCDAKPGQWQMSRAFLESFNVRRFAFGDFHARQELVEGKGGYIGALRQLTFGEEGNPAGFEIWDTETGAVEWVELGAAPVHRTTILRPGDPFDVVMDSSVKQRVRFEGEIPGAETVHKLEGLGVQVETIVPVQERVRRANVPDGIINDPHALIGLWADHQEPRIEGPRLARMLSVYDSLQADARREEKAA